ncbi:MAG: hypothetical protein U0401_08470 [Anaerolineae bacterium]
MTALTQCEMIVGFLTPHRCPNKAVTHCIKCSRSFCDEHVEITAGGLVCLACQQGLAQPVAVAETARSFDATDVLVFQSVGTFDSDDDDTFSDLS